MAHLTIKNNRFCPNCLSDVNANYKCHDCGIIFNHSNLLKIKEGVERKKELEEEEQKLEKKEKLKRPKSSYIYFCMEKLKEKDIKALRATEKIKIISELWKQIGEKEKLPYILLAEEDKKRCAREKFEWNRKQNKG